MNFNKKRSQSILVLILIFFLVPFMVHSQKENHKYPYGKINPLAPKHVGDYAQLIGKCNCKSVAKNQEGLWGDTVNMTWTFRYIMDGMAVQDETIKEDGLHSGSIRLYNPDSSKWYVHYYTSAPTPTPRTLSTWEGNKTEDGKMVLYREQKAPNGTEGFYRLTFSEISEEGYNWIGEWVNTDETFTYSTWKIFCRKEDVHN